MIPRRVSALLWSLLMLMAAACSSDDNKEPGKASCKFEQKVEQATYHYCTDYQGLKNEQVEEIKKVCLIETRGQWSAGGSCSSDQSVGQCRFQKENISFTYTYYADFNEDSAKSNCAAAGGTWQGSLS